MAKKTNGLVKYKDLRKDWNKDIRFVSLQKEREPHFMVIKQIINERIKQQKTQKEIAEMSGLKQEAISALESMHRMPRLGTLLKVLKVLNITELKLVN